MADPTVKQVNEVKAFARGVHISPRKARLAADLVRGMPVHEALDHLRYIGKKAAHPISKLVNSAIASAKHNHAIDQTKLFIKSLTVDGGRVYTRYQPRAYGRAATVRKRTSHINLILGVAPHPLVKKEKTVKLESKVSAPTSPAPPEAEEKEGMAERFKFWRRKKKAPDTTQVPPKQDPKGKPYTSFDRRGNM